MEKNNKHKNKKQSNLKINRETAALFFVLTAFVTSYALILPNKSGILGQVLSTIAFGTFGTTSYVLPLIFLRYFIIHIKQSVQLKEKPDFIWSIIFLVSSSALFEAIHSIFAFKVYGGWVGTNLYPFFKELLNACPGFIVISVILLLSVITLLRISLSSCAVNFFKKLKETIHTKNSIEETQPEFAFNPVMPKQEPIKPTIVNKQEEEKDKNPKSNAQKLGNPKKPIEKIFNYNLPPINLLENDSAASFKTDKEELLKRAALLKSTLSAFDIKVEVKDITPGPVITRYDLVLAPGIRIQAVLNIIDNISLALRAASIRIVPIPEKSAVGVEVPNLSSVTVGLRGILETSIFKNSKSLLTLALGKTADGVGYVTNLASMPHLLIAGTTGSGKSVGIHTIILSILYKARPDEVKFILIDPKRVEMCIYKDIPHIYNPCVPAADAGIITNFREAATTLKKLIVVMEERYAKFAKAAARNIEDYNNKMIETGGEKEFYIVVIIDELADLMLTAQKEIEDSIQRLAQMVRAVGIHLILATQRPSVNVITGVIKANFPARLSFQTTSKIDSRVILDMIGSETLIGKGDMLFLPPGEARPVRLQGAFVSLKEAEKIISFINDQDFPRIYDPVSAEADGKDISGANGEKNAKDLLPALKLINERKRISQDLLKANFGGSAKATNILSLLETEGFIIKPEGTNKWRIDFDKIKQHLDDAANSSGSDN